MRVHCSWPRLGSNRMEPRTTHKNKKKLLTIFYLFIFVTPSNAINSSVSHGAFFYVWRRQTTEDPKKFDNITSGSSANQNNNNNVHIQNHLFLPLWNRRLVRCVRTCAPYCWICALVFVWHQRHRMCVGRGPMCIMCTQCVLLLCVCETFSNTDG